MRVFSRALRRWNLFRVASAAVGLAWLAALVAFVYAASVRQPDIPSVLAAAAVALICYLACAFMVAGPQYRSVETAVSPLWRQLGALGAAALLAVLAYSAFRGDFVHASYSVGPFAARAVASLMLAHDVLATE